MTETRHNPHTPLPELDSTLALLRAAAPRMGLEQRVLARLATAPPPLPWYHHLASPRWMLTAASIVIVAGTVTYGFERSRSTATSLPAHVVARPQRPLGQQPVAAAASVGVPDRPLEQAPMQQAPLPVRHRGIHRAYRAQHARTVLPPGTVAPSHPHLLSSPP